MIKIRNLSKSYGEKLVLNNLNIDIEDGKVFGLVGINGAGKSTLLRLISGVLKADSGEILIDEENVYDNPSAKNKIFFLPDEPFFSTDTTPSNLIDLYKTFYDINEHTYYEYLDYFKLPKTKHLKTFSKGMKRQTFISLALAIKPKYLLLDEAFDGLDPLARLAFKRAVIDAVESKETTIIISSHSLRELEDICDSYGLIDNMELASSGEIQEEISKIHKYQVAFMEMPIKEHFNIEFLSYHQDGRVIRVVVKQELDEFTKIMEHYNPLIIDEIPIDFEELFIMQVENRGYLK